VVNIVYRTRSHLHIIHVIIADIYVLFMCTQSQAMLANANFDLFERVFAHAFPGRDVRVVNPADEPALARHAEIAVVGRRMNGNHTHSKDPWHIAANKALNRVKHVITVCGENDRGVSNLRVQESVYSNHPEVSARTALVQLRATVLPDNPDKYRNLYLGYGGAEWRSNSSKVNVTARSPSKLLAYLNSNCRPHRDKMFELLRPDGAVQLGRCPGEKVCPEVKRSKKSCFAGSAEDAFRGFQFGMAMENSFGPGYITEKMGNVFKSGAVPLFWGDSGAAAAVFNPDAFVDVGAEKSAEDAAALVRSIASNTTRYNAMLSAPIFAHRADDRPHPCYDPTSIAACVGDAIRRVLHPDANITPTGCCVDPPFASRPPLWH
jgi:hypothetical protein